jgi:hypothetical protein
MNVRRFGEQGYVQEEDGHGECSRTEMEPGNSTH